jgi:hypothetical protein
MGGTPIGGFVENDLARPPLSSAMNSRRFNRSKSIWTPLARAELQDIELAANSQRVSERLYNLLVRGRPIVRDGRADLFRFAPNCSYGCVLYEYTP